MIEKIILNIHHSDDYTDYLFQTACLTNKRVIPLVNPDRAQIERNSDANTMVLRCLTSADEPGEGRDVISVSATSRTIRLLPKYYLGEDGRVDASHAQMVRSSLEESLRSILLESGNLREAYRRYFPLFWLKRQKIYSDPRLFFVYCGLHGDSETGFCPMPIGAVLKAIDEGGDTFRLGVGGGCGCRERPLLIDYGLEWKEWHRMWRLYSWCPTCQSRREIQAWDFQRSSTCDRHMDFAMQEYDRGQGESTLSLFDLVDTLRSA